MGQVRVMKKRANKLNNSCASISFRIWIPISISLFLMLFVSLATALGTGEIVRVSTDSTGGEANGYSTEGAVSADGSHVCFSSASSSLVTGDANGFSDVFLKDTQTGAVKLVSTDSSESQGNGASDRCDISGDGRYVAFASLASNLVPNDTNGKEDVFVKDMLTGATTRLSTDSSGGQGLIPYGFSYSSYPSISDDGRFVVFQSLIGLNPEDYWHVDIYLKDTVTGEIKWISSNNSGIGGNADSSHPSISANGQYVTFHSYASNLVSGDNGAPFNDVFVKDMTTGTIAGVSKNSLGAWGDSASSFPSVSADGRYIVFQSAASNLVPGDINSYTNIFVKDMETGGISLVSTDSSGNPGNFYSQKPDISADGRFVSFYSDASNLVLTDLNAANDVFLKDRMTNESYLISADPSGYAANGSSLFARLSDDGRYVNFLSFATNIVPDDNNGVGDVFLTRTAYADSCIASRPPLSINLTNIYWNSYADYLARGLSVDYRLTNDGSSYAYGVQLTGLTTIGGATYSMALPRSLGTISGGSSYSFTVIFAVSEGATSFVTRLHATANDGCGMKYYYPGPG